MAYLLRLKNIGDGAKSRVSRRDQQIDLALLVITNLFELASEAHAT
jgi:hypothetical protein